MLKPKQIIVIGGILLLTGVLYSLDIKGLVKPKGERGLAQKENNVADNSITLESVSETAKQMLNANLANQITEAENNLKQAPVNERLDLQNKLIQKWLDVNQPTPAAFLKEQIALQQSDLKNWLATGNLFTDAYQNGKDSTITNTLVSKAIFAYNKALSFDDTNLEAKTGLGVAYVNEGKNPMQGIQLLLSVVAKEPKNLNANLNLGLFSMKSGQFEKAINRFKTVLETKETPEAYFYLASSYENLGNKTEAIIAYQKSKELAADPSLTKFVDQKIIELNK